MPSPLDVIGVDNPLSLQADETAARQLDTGFATEVRGLVHDPVTGLAGRDPEAALSGIAETIPLLAELKDRYLAQAMGPRQKALLEPLIDQRLERAGSDLGRIMHQATSVLDDRITDLQRRSNAGSNGRARSAASRRSSASSSTRPTIRRGAPISTTTRRAPPN